MLRSHDLGRCSWRGCVQVRLRDDASVSEQDQRHEAVGAALDQELPVWRSVEEDSVHRLLTPPPSRLPARVEALYRDHRHEFA